MLIVAHKFSYDLCNQSSHLPLSSRCRRAEGGGCTISEGAQRRTRCEGATPHRQQRYCPPCAVSPCRHDVARHDVACTNLWHAFCPSTVNGQHATTTHFPNWKLTTTTSPMLPPTSTTPIAPPTTQQFTPTTVRQPRAHNELVASPPLNRAHRPPPTPFGRPSRHKFFALAAHSFYPHAALRRRPQYPPRRCSHRSLHRLHRLYLRLDTLPAISPTYQSKILPYSHL